MGRRPEIGATFLIRFIFLAKIGRNGFGVALEGTWVYCRNVSDALPLIDNNVNRGCWNQQLKVIKSDNCVRG